METMTVRFTYGEKLAGSAKNGTCDRAVIEKFIERAHVIVFLLFGFIWPLIKARRGVDGLSYSNIYSFFSHYFSLVFLDIADMSRRNNVTGPTSALTEFLRVSLYIISARVSAEFVSRSLELPLEQLLDVLELERFSNLSQAPATLQIRMVEVRKNRRLLQGLPAQM